MPVRATKRGGERTPLEGSYDVLICGASFAGLSVARELAGTGARVLLIDRYEIGERQTSACAAPTEWLRALDLEDSVRQTFEELVVHTPQVTVRMGLPWTFSTFDYRSLCGLLWEQCDAEFETAKVERRGEPPNGEAGSFTAARPDPPAPRRTAAAGISVVTDRGELTAPLVVDALGWRRLLGSGDNVQPPEARLSRGLEVHPWASNDDLEIWIERGVVPAGYGWSFPAGEEVRVGVGSFDPRFHVKQPTVELAERLGVRSVRYQGNWIPHQMRRPVEDSVFFAGDSAGHCLPTTAEGIRTAFYFGLACGRELRLVADGLQTREQALTRYASFCDEHEYAFRWLLHVQRLVGRVNPHPAMTTGLRLMSHPAFVTWAFRHYLAIAPPEFALDGAAPFAGLAPARALAA